MSEIADRPGTTGRATRNVAVLIAAQAILGAQMPVLFVVGGLAGQMIAPSPLLATAPISLIVFGSMTTSWWLAAFMQRFGRRAGFYIGAVGGALGALLSALALWVDHFPLFLLGAYFSGIYMSAQAFYRFAAADAAPPAFRAKAISYVLAGGLISALIGPQLATQTSEWLIVPFVGSYLAAAALNLAGLVLFPLLDLPPPKRPAPGAAPGRSRLEMLRDPRIAVAVICGAVSYALMNLMMTSTPLAVVGCGFSVETSGHVVSAHVVAMFAPSFVTGPLINRFGTAPIIAAGLICLAAAGGVALTGVELTQFFGALILLGVGWNFSFIGATTLLASCHTEAERGRIQGINDTVVFGCVTLASLASGFLIGSGETVVAGWTAVNLAMVPFLALAGAALIWLAFRGPSPGPAPAPDPLP
ncbi:MAG: MFS transporter [Pseudomonadota bacterium]